MGLLLLQGGAQAEALDSSFTSTALAGASSPLYISRLPGRKDWTAIASIDLDDSPEYIATGKVTHPSRTYVGRVLAWGNIERTIPLPSGMPQASRMRIRIGDTDLSWRDKMGSQTPQGRRVTVKFLQGGTSEAAADTLFTGTIEEFSTGPGYLEISAVSDLLSWLDEPIPEVITQANYPEFPDVKQQFLPVVLGHVVGRAVSQGFSSSTPPPAVPSSGELIARADAATALAATLDAIVWNPDAEFPFILNREWMTRAEIPFFTTFMNVIYEINFEFDQGVAVLSDVEYARAALVVLIAEIGEQAAIFAAIPTSVATRTAIIATYNSHVNSFFGADFANALAKIDQQITSLGGLAGSPPDDPAEELFLIEGTIPLPHIGFGPVGSPADDRDRWGAAMHPLWNVLGIYRKRPSEDAFTPVDPGEYEQNVETARAFGEYPDRTFSPTYIDFLIQQDDGTEIRMDADGAFAREAFGAMPAAGYEADGFKGPLRNPVDAFLIMRELIYPKAGTSARFDIDSLAALLVKFRDGGDLIPPLFCDRAIIESLTPRELLGQFHACYQTDMFESKKGLLKMVRIDDSDENRPVLNEFKIERNSFAERSPVPTVNRFRANYTRDYGAGNWLDLALANNTEDQTNRQKIEEQTIDQWFIRDASTAMAAIADRLRYTALGSYRQRLEVSLPLVSAWLELAKLFGITHRQGMQIAGYSNREVKTVGISIALDKFMVTIDSVVRVPEPFAVEEEATGRARPTAHTEDPVPAVIPLNTSRVRREGEPAAAYDNDEESYFTLDITGGTGVSVFAIEHFHTWITDPFEGAVSVKFKIRVRVTIDGNAPDQAEIGLFSFINNESTSSSGLVAAFGALPVVTTDWADYETAAIPIATFNGIANPVIRISLAHPSGELGEPYPRYDIADIWREDT